MVNPMLKGTLAAGETKKVLVEDDESKVSEERWWADATGLNMYRNRRGERKGWRWVN